MGHTPRAAAALGADRRATTTLELAMVGPAFFFMIMLILTISLDLFAQVLLDDSVRNAVREVQTGKVTNGGQFASAVCGEFGAVASTCMTALQYDVQGGTQFSSITPATLAASGTLSTAANFSGINPTATGAPVFILAQVAFLVPFEFVGTANGVLAENGTPALYSATATGAEF